MTDPILVTTTTAVDNALAALACSPFLYLDCEGHRLGCIGGALSLLSVGTTCGRIFLFDAIALRAIGQLQRVLNAVAGSERITYVWDGRKDYSELWHGHGVRLRAGRVLDLQIADVGRRAGAQAEQPGVHQLGSLKGVLREHGIRGHYPAERARHDEWMIRPLPEDLVSYAVRDIIILALAREHFSRRGYLDDTDALLAQSARYITLHERFRPAPEDAFQGSSLLPLDILHDPPLGAARLDCMGCKRALGAANFAQAQPGAGVRLCLICSTLVQRGKACLPSPPRHRRTRSKQKIHLKADQLEQLQAYAAGAVTAAATAWLTYAPPHTWHIQLHVNPRLPPPHVGVTSIQVPLSQSCSVIQLDREKTEAWRSYVCSTLVGL
ncbi:hypothetical protein AURDEDRAFT_183239 [Auricularia subglabra TFB-10046 SS5]|nr:hypothetical protein AURDEDRAFT_183239 [Auricularia subglabra TFB-10046 SS5]